MFRKAKETLRAMKKTYKVNEIFCSLQGEGYFTGTAAVFLRFSGCNRRCSFCDTDHFDGRDMSADEIVAEVSRFTPRHIVVTGGEPALQLDSELVRALKAEKFFIQVETNGSLPLPPDVDWVTCSPKDAPWEIGRIDELKVVYQGQDVETLASLLPAPRLFLQPCSGENIAETVDYIMSHPRWRLSLQTHKLIDIR